MKKTSKKTSKAMPQVQIRLDDKSRAKVDSDATAEGRSRSSMIRHMIAVYKGEGK